MNKVYLVTGGASGIGKAIALKLAQQGHNVVISGRRAEVGEQEAFELQAQAADQAQVRFIQNDVTDEEAVQALVAQIVAEFGRLDGAVNNAGVLNEMAALAESQTDKVRQMLDINVLGTYQAMKYEAQQMLKQGAGAIVNITSIAGLNGMPMLSGYSAAKHAIVGLTKSAAMDYAAQGLRINAVAPGATRTEMLDGFDEAAMAAVHPMNRVASPEEIADAVAWLLSDQSSFVTGHILSVDGGFQAK